MWPKEGAAGPKLAINALVLLRHLAWDHWTEEAPTMVARAVVSALADQPDVPMVVIAAARLLYHLTPRFGKGSALAGAVTPFLDAIVRFTEREEEVYVKARRAGLRCVCVLQHVLCPCALATRVA